MKNWPFDIPPLRSQKDALEATRYRAGILWWMEVGLGKTMLALAEFEMLRKQGVVDQMMVFTVNTFKGGWQDEARKLGMPEGVGVWPVDSTKGLWALIMNYEALDGRGHDAAVKWMERGRTYLCVDECQNIKNHNSKRTKKMIALAKTAVVSRPMTGTWGENVMDLWPQLRVAKALSGVNPFVFRNRYAKMGGYMGKKVVGIREDASDAFGELLRAHVFEAKQQDYLTDLPPSASHVVKLEMPKALQKHYREMKQDFITEVGDGLEVKAEMVITQITKLQQITCGFVMDAGRVEWLVPPTQSPKFLFVRDLAESLGTKKLIAFVFHNPALLGLQEALTEWGITHTTIRGGMTADEVKEAKASFNQDGGARVLIGQIVAAGAAHTLLGGPIDTCSTTVFVENVYSLIKRTQAEGRNRRHGQTKSVQYYDLSMSATEDAVTSALQAKTNLVDAVRRSLVQ